MWCKVCRQDVPAQASDDKQGLCCPRCGEAVCAEPHGAKPARPHSRAKMPSFDRKEVETTSRHAGKKSAIQDASVPPATAIESPLDDCWELDEQLKHIERVLQGGRAKANAAAAVRQGRAMRFDEAHATQPDWHVPAVERPGQGTTKNRRRLGASVLAWLLLVPGAISFVFGGVLLAWSLVTGRQDLWNIGLPSAIGGQVALVLGLAIQIERLWLEHRDATDKLDNVGRQLHELMTHTLTGVGQGATSSAFYSHLAGGAGPRLLLADLKSQIDLLALKLAETEGI